MRVVLLGTGDAIGTPRVGCSCTQCTYAHDHGLQRLRTSLLVEYRGRHILIETGPDLRQQLLATGSPHIDAVLWTHGHYDHFMGFGEFYRVQKLPVVYAPPPVMDYCGGIFRFLAGERHPIPAFSRFSLFGLTCTFLPVTHPPAYTCGVLLEGDGVRIGYTSDTNSQIPGETARMLTGVDLLFVDALLPSHLHVPKHMNYQEACDLAGTLDAVDFRCVHQSHHLPWGLPHLGCDNETFLF